MTTLQIVLVSIAGGIVVLATALIPVWIVLFQLYYGKKTMRRVASDRKGMAIEGGCCEIPQVVLRHGESKVHLQFRVYKSNKTRRMLVLTAPWPDSSARITIYRETFWTRAKSYIGLEDIKVGDRDFDDLFVLQSNRPDELPATLHQAVRSLLTRIHSRMFGPSLNINIVGGRVTMAIESRSWKFLLVDQQIDEFLELHDLLTQSAKPDLYKPSSSWTPIERDGVCLVCGEGIQSQRVECKRCRTPHHKECWDYIGSCSIFGCGSGTAVSKR
ncbi:MAG: RING finger protein [Planctomycetota bacterium]